MGKNIQKTVGRRIRDVRTKQGISQSQLALMTHMTKSYMSEIEAGKKNLTLRTLAKIADCLGVGIEHLICDEPCGAMQNSGGGGFEALIWENDGS